MEEDDKFEKSQEESKVEENHVNEEQEYILQKTTCVHQIWIQGAHHFEETQAEFFKFSQYWKEQYPHFEYKLWAKEDFLPIIEAYSPKLLEAYHAAEKASYSAASDIARYAILHQNDTGCESGLYVDTDYESFKPCEYLFNDEKIKMVLVAMNLSKNKLFWGNTRYSTAWIFAKQQSELLKYVLDRIAHNPYNPAKHTKFQYAWEITGPKGLSDVIEQFGIEKNPEYRILPHSMIEGGADFSNVAITFMKKEEILQLHPFAVGIHRCAGSWIKDINGIKSTFGMFYAWYNSWSDFISIGLVIVPILIVITLFVIWRVHIRRRKNTTTKMTTQTS